MDKRMITTVTLNPCIDHTVRLEKLTPGALNLVEDTRVDLSGKGVNVSKVLRTFGIPTMCTGINYDGNGQQLATCLDENSIAHDFAMARGNIRTNIKVVDLSRNEMTEINHRGYPVDGVVLNQCLEKVVALAKNSRMMVFSGRIPVGAGDDIYQKCLEAIRNLPVKTVVDAEGEPLRLALEEKPYLIKPNTYELEKTFGCKIGGRDDVVKVAREIIAGGVKVVCVSMGGDGAMIVSRQEAYYAPALDIAPKGFQGAGDSMVAGVCKAVYEGRGLDDMLRFGVAAASASLIREGTLLCQMPDFLRLLALVQVEPVASK